MGPLPTRLNSSEPGIKGTSAENSVSSARLARLSCLSVFFASLVQVRDIDVIAPAAPLLNVKER